MPENPGAKYMQVGKEWFRAHKFNAHPSCHSDVTITDFPSWARTQKILLFKALLEDNFQPLEG